LWTVYLEVGRLQVVVILAVYALAFEPEGLIPWSDRLLMVVSVEVVVRLDGNVALLSGFVSE
jgi:hypothetical protein